jgi:hypothetical protein
MTEKDAHSFVEKLSETWLSSNSLSRILGNSCGLPSTSLYDGASYRHTPGWSTPCWTVDSWTTRPDPPLPAGMVDFPRSARVLTRDVGRNWPDLIALDVCPSVSVERAPRHPLGALRARGILELAGTVD